jgi:hypothetical protein
MQVEPVSGASRHDRNHVLSPRAKEAALIVAQGNVRFSTCGKASNAMRVSETDIVPFRWGTPLLPPSSMAGKETVAPTRVDCPNRYLKQYRCDRSMLQKDSFRRASRTFVSKRKFFVNPTGRATIRQTFDGCGTRRRGRDRVQGSRRYPQESPIC